MFRLIKILQIVLVLIIGMIGSMFIAYDSQPYKVKLLHPGVSLTEKVEKTLYRNTETPDEFFMNVATVVCGDDQCRIDTIAIYWDNLGFYKRLDLPQGVELEKAKGIHFSPEDYNKLDGILANRKSSLIDVYKEEVVGTISSDAVDGISGATIILNTNDYVAGAVWTCYTLWHWTNGGIHNIIRNIVGADLETKDLVNALSSDISDKRQFAIEQLIRRKEYSKSILDTIVSTATTFNNEYAKLVVDYFEGANDSELYFAAMEQLIGTVSTDHSARFLSSLYGYPMMPTEHYLEGLCSQFQDLDQFQEVDILFRIFEKRESTSPIAISFGLEALRSEDIRVARRAYWFLAKQQLSQLQNGLLQDFHSLNKHRL